MVGLYEVLKQAYSLVAYKYIINRGYILQQHVLKTEVYLRQ